MALLGVGGFAVVLYAAGLDRLPALLGADPGWVATAFAAMAAVTVVSTVRWSQLGDALAAEQVMTFSGYYAALLTSRVLGLFVSRSGSDLGVRFAAMTAGRKTAARVAATSVLLDQMFDLCLLLAWLLPALAILGGAVPPGVGGALLAGASVIAIAGMVNLHQVLGYVVAVLGRVLGVVGRAPVVGRFLLARRRNLETLLDVEHLTQPRLLALGAVTFLRYLLNAFMFFAVSQALGLDIPWSVFLLTGAVVQLSLVVAATPGGLGVMDAGWVLGLTAAGVPASTAAAFLVGQRALQYIGFPALGALSYVLLLPTRRQVRGPAPASGTGDTTPPASLP